MAKNDAHFTFAIAALVGYPGALIFGYIQNGCDEYPNQIDEHRWRKISIEEFCRKLHLAKRTAIRALNLLSKSDLIISLKGNGVINLYRPSEYGLLCQKGASAKMAPVGSAKMAQVTPPSSAKMAPVLVPKWHR